MVNYYQDGESLEPIKVIDYVCRDISGMSAFCIGNMIKYIMRSGKKPGVSAEDDLAKARDYAYMLVYGVWPDNSYISVKCISEAQNVPF